MSCPDRPVGRLLEPRAPSPPEPDPYCDFCAEPKCRGDCTEKRQVVAGFAGALARTAEDIASENGAGSVITPKVARPDWVQSSVEDSIRHLGCIRRGIVPEVLHGAFLRTTALRLLRCVYGSDEATATEVARYFRERGG